MNSEASLRFEQPPAGEPRRPSSPGDPTTETIVDTHWLLPVVALSGKSEQTNVQISSHLDWRGKCLVLYTDRFLQKGDNMGPSLFPCLARVTYDRYDGRNLRGGERVSCVLFIQR